MELMQKEEITSFVVVNEKKELKDIFICMIF